MISPVDLRIGNIVDKPGKGFIRLMSGEDIDRAAREVYNPIPITEALILAMGFAQRTDPLIFELRPNNFAYHILAKRVTIAHPGNILWHWLGTHIDHVHQLQNLFYCIVGYDLNTSKIVEI